MKTKQGLRIQNKSVSKSEKQVLDPGSMALHYDLFEKRKDTISDRLKNFSHVCLVPTFGQSKNLTTFLKKSARLLFEQTNKLCNRPSL